MYFTFPQLISLWKWRGSSFEKKQQLEFPSPKDVLCQVWMKLAQWFWSRFFKAAILFYYFPIISHLGRAWLFNWTDLNPLHQGILCAKFGWNWLVVLEKKMKMWKVYRLTDRQTDDGRQVIRKAHLSFQLRWAKNEKCMFKVK